MKQRKRVIALGFFDGVHLGHAALLKTVVQRAAERNASPAAVTFDTHPDQLILGQSVPLLTSPEERTELMGRLYGVHDIIVVPFDQHMMHMPWEVFLTDFLVQECGAVHLVAGHDFCFGYRGEGTPERLKAKCAELGLGCDIIPAVTMEGITVSSTYIRTLIAQGEMERAAAFLGHPYTVIGQVRHGKQLGRKLGFPTINLILQEGVIVPAFGVYATLVTLPNGERRMAVTNVGVRPTTDGENTSVTVEGYILDYSGDLYGQSVQMEFYRHLRPERKFESVEELTAMVLHNADETRAYFAPKT
ncbi:MAG: riboflavin biosynthesis protein RibF [Oscillospiraceae bacterium]|nr:riboflavin biosynthesis protein RibF [Oscillospiraceae bacterium]